MLKNKYKKIVDRYIKVFTKKHDLIFLDYHIFDTIVFFENYFFDLNVIRYDIDNNIQKKFILKWYEYSLKNSMSYPAFYKFYYPCLSAQN